MRKILLPSILMVLFGALNAYSFTLDLLRVGWRSLPGGRPIVTVLITPAKGVAASAIGDVESAIHNWNKALFTHPYAPFLGLVRDQKANLTIHISVSDGPVLGMTSWKTITPQSCALQSVAIQLSGKAFGEQLSNVGSINVAQHELGHALGWGPTDEPGHLMYGYAGYSRFAGSHIVPISSCDLNAINKIYPLNPLCLVPAFVSCP